MKLLKCHIIVTVLVLTFLSTVTFSAYQWSSHGFDPNPISLQKISHQADVSEGSATITLDVNTAEGATITANNTVNGPAELTNGKDRLVTEYKLSFSGNGSSKTGGNDTSYETYNTFLSTAAVIKYVSGYNTVDVTLHVRASNTGGKLADSGSYSARQTLTVSWIDP